MGATAEWIDDTHVKVDGVRFAGIWSDDGLPPEWDGIQSDEFAVWKPPTHLRQFVTMLEGFEGPNVVEVGIATGGSTALITRLTRPRKLVAFELAPEPPPQLAAFIRAEGLDEVLRPHCGVDQADRERIAGILDAEFGKETLDLVVDDASHLYEPTRATFDVLFPRLRPGGTYVIEDWNWLEVAVHELAGIFSSPTPEMRTRLEHHFMEALADPTSPVRGRLESWLAAGGDDVWRADVERWLAASPPGEAAPPRPDPTWRTLPPLGKGGRPLARFVLELGLAVASAPDVVAGLTLENGWMSVRRGPAHIDPGSFRSSDLTSDLTVLLAP